MGLPWTGTTVFIDFHLFLSLSWIRRFMEERCYSFRILKPFWNKLERDFLIEEKNFIEFPILLHSLIIPCPHWSIFSLQLNITEQTETVSSVIMYTPRIYCGWKKPLESNVFHFFFFLLLFSFSIDNLGISCKLTPACQNSAGSIIYLKPRHPYGLSAIQNHLNQ